MTHGVLGAYFWQKLIQLQTKLRLFQYERGLVTLDMQGFQMSDPVFCRLVVVLDVVEYKT